MKIVMNDAGQVVARHGDAEQIFAKQYAGFGPVLIGIIPDASWSQTAAGDDMVAGSAIDVARDLAKQMVRTEVAAMTADLRADYPQEERDTWGVKLSEAKAIFDGGDVDGTIYIKALVAKTGKDAVEVAKSVIAKASAYADVVATAEAYRDAKYTAIDKAKNIKAIVTAVSEA